MCVYNFYGYHLGHVCQCSLAILLKKIEFFFKIQNEKHESKKDPENAHRHKIEEEIAAAAAVGNGGFVFHEHHDKKETKKEEEEANGKKHHHF